MNIMKSCHRQGAATGGAQGGIGEGRMSFEFAHGERADSDKVR